MTITSKKRAKSCLSDDELPIAYQYNGLEGEALWSFFTHPEYDDMHTSPFAFNAIPLKVDNELTQYGKEFLNDND